MDKELDFKVLGIATAIKQERFTVPSNQREYSWLAKYQVKDFLLDISQAMRNPNKPYFLGTIVLTLSDSNQFEIADGQQRLATTTMVLAGIRDWFRKKGDTNNYKDIENSYLFTFDRKQQDTIPKLTLNVDDNEYFKNKILQPYNNVHNNDVHRSHKLIEQASEAIKSHIDNIESTYGSENAKNILNDWIMYLEDRAMVVILTVSNPDSAFMMFETLNDRGLKTSQVDLVKNHLFKIAGDRLHEAQKLWSSMKSSVESVSDSDAVTLDFLRAVCCIQYGHTTKKNIMLKIRENTPNKTEAIRVLGTMEDLSRYFAAILNPDHPKWNEYSSDIRKSIQVINLFKITQIRPLMLSVAKSFNSKNASSSFKKLVSWSIRFVVLGLRGGRLDEGYAKLAHSIHLKEINNTDDLKETAEKLVINDSEFKSAFEIARVSRSFIARYFLRSLETTARGEKNPEFVPNEDTVINLEHVMPSSPNEHWNHISEQDAHAYVSRLGNLALLQAEKNSKIGNLPFDFKKPIYNKSSFVLTQQIGDMEEWNTAKIDARQKVMAELAVKTWSL